jgi:hypothetical protein
LDASVLALILDLGVPGLLAWALWTVVQGWWIPRPLHDRIVDQYVAEIEKQAKEINRLQGMNQEFVNLTLTGALMTNNALELARRLESGGIAPPPKGGA